MTSGQWIAGLATLVGQISVISAAFTDRKKIRRNRAIWGLGLIVSGFAVKVAEDYRLQRSVSHAEVAHLR